MLLVEGRAYSDIQAGQERYKSLAPIYFRNSNAAVIAYDITQVSLEPSMFRHFADSPAARGRRRPHLT